MQTADEIAKALANNPEAIKVLRDAILPPWTEKDAEDVRVAIDRLGVTLANYGK